jgi:hypothetical protein
VTPHYGYLLRLHQAQNLFVFEACVVSFAVLLVHGVGREHLLNTLASELGFLVCLGQAPVSVLDFDSVGDNVEHRCVLVEHRSSYLRFVAWVHVCFFEGGRSVEFLAAYFGVGVVDYQAGLYTFFDVYEVLVVTCVACEEARGKHLVQISWLHRPADVKRTHILGCQSLVCSFIPLKLLKFLHRGFTTNIFFFVIFPKLFIVEVDTALVSYVSGFSLIRVEVQLVIP